MNVENWLKVLEDKGIGELLITSVDRDGTKSGFDYELVSKVSKICNVPLIISGGAGEKNHLLEILKNNNLDAIAVGSILHLKNQTVKSLKSFLINNDIKLGSFSDNYNERSKVGIIDYGCGNIKSIIGALKHLGIIKTVLVNSENEIEVCDCLILPGVGAYGHAIKD